jgi:adenosylcobinamide-phosphate synthase
MAAGAGSLQVALGGPAVYHGHLEVRPMLGEGRAPQASDIPRALTLVRYGVRLWLLTAFVVGALAALTAGMAHA